MAIDGITAGGYKDIVSQSGYSTAAARPVKATGEGVPIAIPKEKESEGMAGNSGGKNDEERQIRAAVSQANLKATRTRCEYSVDEKTNRISIKMIDEETSEIIKEIPPEKSLEMIAKVWELAGILLDEKR